MAADIDEKHQSAVKLPAPNATDSCSMSRLGEQLCGGSESAVCQLLSFGRYLHQLSLRLGSKDASHTDHHRRMLCVSCQLEFFVAAINMHSVVLAMWIGK